LELAVNTASLAKCAECGLQVPADQTIRHKLVQVCASCKPAFLQKLAEGAQVNTGGFRWAGFWIRFAAIIVDALILLPLTVAMQLMIGMSFAQIIGLESGSIMMLIVSQLLGLATGVAYEVAFVGRFGATLGKMACGIRVIMPGGGKVSYLRALARYFAKLLNMLTIYIGYVMAAFDPVKRGLHDRICNTLVVYEPTAASVPSQCPRCQSTVLEIAPTSSGFTRCNQCYTTFQVEAFPALFRQPEPELEAEPVLLEGESACFYHAEKKALLPCHACGRFLCALCDCEINSGHYCPACLEAGVTKGKIANLESRRTKQDSIALSLAIAPMLLFYFTIVTAPAALYLAIKHWNAPRGVSHRTKVRLVLAMIVASLQIIGWIAIVIFAIWALSVATNL
jgi:uncharacterized RDD family membrane protein YckC